LVENIDNWKLHLSDWRWERLTDRRWPRWEIRRKDGKRNHLFEIQQARWSGDWESPGKFERDMETLSTTLGARPDFDMLAKLYRPDTPHETLPEVEGEYRVFRIRIDGVTVEICRGNAHDSGDGRRGPARANPRQTDIRRVRQAVRIGELRVQTAPALRTKEVYCRLSRHVAPRES
jgi:hypothetical protein